jgi:hypothetical protein
MPPLRFPPHDGTERGMNALKFTKAVPFLCSHDRGRNHCGRLISAVSARERFPNDRVREFMLRGFQCWFVPRR